MWVQVLGLDQEASCVKFAVDNCAKVINNSYAAKGDSQLLTNEFHYAHDNGCVCVAAAGNDESMWRVTLPRILILQ